MPRTLEVTAVDQFLADEKTLHGPAPEFGMKRWGHGAALREGVWPIANSAGIVESGHLRIAIGPPTDKPLTLALIFRNSCVYRADFVTDTECHSNPWWARQLNLPTRVCGPHFHSWAANRDYALEYADGKLPCREAMPAQVRRFEQAFAWLADQVKITLTPDQRLFSPPVGLLL
jgi:hypothetical protein